MTAAGWAAVAAFFAAICSVLNVAVSVRLARKSELEKWRRDVERKLVLDVLSLSGRMDEYSILVDHAWDYTRVSAEVMEKIQCARDQLHERTQAVYVASLELQLVADRSVVEAVHAIAKSFESLRHWMRPGGPDNKLDLYWSTNNHLVEQRRVLVSATRSDLGLNRIDLPNPL